ncbi:hypothetical protein SEUCBS139899_009482 [Sporothrix eucalyptigena]
MCRLSTITWACGHKLEVFTPCEDATLAPISVGCAAEDSSDQQQEEEENETYFYGELVYNACENFVHVSLPNSLEAVPFCMNASCVPNYWSCCQCHRMEAFGCTGDLEDGANGKPSRAARLARLAPTKTVKEGAHELQLGDVCGDDMDEELRAGYFDEPSVTAVPCPSRAICSGCQAEKEVNDVEISREELHANLAEMQDTISPLPEQRLYKGETDCGHMRCDKCTRWRRCPCVCLCPYLIPSTRRSCSTCLRSRCGAINYLGLREYIQHRIDSESQPRPQQ